MVKLFLRGIYINNSKTDLHVCWGWTNTQIWSGVTFSKMIRVKVLSLTGSFSLSGILNRLSHYSTCGLPKFLHRGICRQTYKNSLLCLQSIFYLCHSQNSLSLTFDNSIKICVSEDLLMLSAYLGSFGIMETDVHFPPHI